MTSIHQLIHGGAKRQPSLDEALAELVGTNSRQHISNSELSSRSASPVAFGGLIDLMRSATPAAQGNVICEECKTLNRPGACYCKTCMHKLPAYFASADPRPFVIWRKREREEDAASALDLVAVCVVLILLVLLTANIPVGR
jgi:hypothetical protein